MTPFDRRLARRAALLTGTAALLGACSVFNGDFFDDLFATSKVPATGRREDIALPRLGFDNPGRDQRPIVLPAPETNASWTQPGGNAAHVMGNLALGGKVSEAWTADIGAGAGYRRKITAQPLVSGSRVFSMDSDGVVSAFQIATGRRDWRTDTQGEKDRSTNVGGGISTDGTTVFAATGRAEVLGLNAATGAIKWRVPLGTPARSAPTIADGKLFVSTLDNRAVAFSASDGKQLWAYQGTSSVTSVLGETSPAAANGLVVVGFGSGELAALRAENGSVAWTDTLAPIGGRNSLTDFSAVRGLPVIDQGRVIAIGLGGLMVALDLTAGRRLWERQIGGGNTPWVAGDTVFVVTSDQRLIALARDDGADRWSVEMPRYENPARKRDPIFWLGPVLVNQRLIVSGTNGIARSFNPLNGADVGTYKLSGPAALPPIVAQGMVFLVSADGKMLALK
jgi:outer membrane protein assembly factor BamB